MRKEKVGLNFLEIGNLLQRRLETQIMKTIKMGKTYILNVIYSKFSKKKKYIYLFDTKGFL